MPRDGALVLADYPADMVRLACTRCERRGQYRRRNLVAKYGTAITLPSLRRMIVTCERQDRLGDACGAYFVDLAPWEPR